MVDYIRIFAFIFGNLIAKTEGWLLLWQINKHDRGRTLSKGEMLWCTDGMPDKQRRLICLGHQTIPKLQKDATI